MRGDINFLDSMKQGEKKRNSNATSAVVVVLVLIVIAVMIFFFAKLKITYNQNAELIQQLEQDKNSSIYARREKEYLKVKNQFEQYLAETAGKDAVNGKTESIKKLSRDVFNVIFDSTYNEGMKEISIEKFTFDSVNNSITIDGYALGNGTTDDLTIAKEYLDSFENRLDKAYIMINGERVEIFRNKPSLEINNEPKIDKDWNGNSVSGFIFFVSLQLVDFSDMEVIA